MVSKKTRRMVYKIIAWNKILYKEAFLHAMSEKFIFFIYTITLLSILSLKEYISTETLKHI